MRRGHVLRRFHIITKEAVTAFNTDIIELPCTLIDIGEKDERFTLIFDRFDEGLTEHSVKSHGLSGIFKAVYKCRGMDCCFDIDLTIGNLYYFSYDLDTAWDIYFGRNSKAVLRSYGEPPFGSELIFAFNEIGKCTVSGHFMNSEYGFRNGISFEMAADNSVISSQIVAMKNFFDKLDEIQGNKNFY
ncbi:hypothetical protein [Ruminococcus albus]|uniref:Uncharacterized protein n=1 Tax=Ruminococcus albus TaxID=1264 RepID=A0A1H7IPR4_RUMAL|nr:hypothetical protein [Ruminococcus albus]SEK64469.1 hypothetical protein SAMN05216469_10440 [Ruminococcus albus]